jgi:hypothetical protein
MFRASSCPSSVATTTAVAASGLPFEGGDSSAVDHIMSGYDEVHSFHTVRSAVSVIRNFIIYIK